MPLTNNTRAWAPRGITIKVLRLLLNVHQAFPDAKVEIVTAALACGCPTNTIHQAAHRLRAQGLPIETFPRGPWNQWTGGATHYHLPDDALDQAHLLLRSLLNEQADVDTFFAQLEATNNETT